MKIAIDGNINIHMFSTPLRDIDFICWGPFIDPVAPCDGQLTSNKIVSCSYSPNPTENCYIPNGVVGQYYILLITNYSNQPCSITFEKTSGSGETDCSIVPPPIGSNTPLCFGDNLQLWADNFNGATYFWTGPDDFESPLQNPLLEDVTIDNTGDYELVITVNGSSSAPVITEVEIFPKPTPDFDNNDACFGDTTFFEDVTTVNPAEYPVTTWQWGFGDGQSSTEQNPWHLYGIADEYEVSLTTYTEDMGCPQTFTKTVHVNNAANVDAGPDQEIINGWTTYLDGTIDGGSGTYDILWTPEDKVENPNIEDPETMALSATQVFTITVTDASTQCINSDSISVIITGGPLSVTTFASPMVVCQGEIVNLSASPSGGSGNNSYSWTSTPAGFTADIKEPSDFPEVTTTYYVSVFDGQITATGEITVVVNPNPSVDAGDDKTIIVGTYTVMDNAIVSSGSGTFNYYWTPESMLEDASLFHPQTVLLDAAAEYNFHVIDNKGCQSNSDNIWVFTGGDGLSVNPTASPDIICLEDSTTLTANPFGGSGNYTYYWYADNGWESSETNPKVSPLNNTVYTCDVSDGFKTVSNTTNVIVNPLPLIDLLPEDMEYYSIDTIKACVRDSVVLDAGNSEMNHIWSNTSTSQHITVQTNGNWIDFKTNSVEVKNPVTLCAETASMTIYFDFNLCGIGVEETSALSKNISVLPNPSNGLINIEFKDLEGMIDISISDIRGRVVFTKSNVNIRNNFTKSLDITSVPDGVYLLNIKHDSGVYNSQIIKQ